MGLVAPADLQGLMLQLKTMGQNAGIPQWLRNMVAEKAR